jgi:hypothetical protein
MPLQKIPLPLYDEWASLDTFACTSAVSESDPPMNRQRIDTTATTSDALERGLTERV